jgi:hypothetical protein
MTTILKLTPQEVRSKRDCRRGKAAVSTQRRAVSPHPAGGDGSRNLSRVFEALRSHEDGPVSQLRIEARHRTLGQFLCLERSLHRSGKAAWLGAARTERAFAELLHRRQPTLRQSGEKRREY